MSPFDGRPLHTPVERQNALSIGSIESVAPGHLVARLSDEAPQTTALNAGAPAPFPRLNGFVVVPHEAGALVGIVTWIGIESSRPPATSLRADSGLIDLPFSSRRMSITPIGTLKRRVVKDENPFRLERGVSVFPSVGDPVALPSAAQLSALLRGDAENSHVPIGTALLANGETVRVDPDKLFGRHLAVLGNTGSGKSCSVAGLIRWSIEAAVAARAEGAQGNSRFIVLDPNGEYQRSFDGLDGVRTFQVPPADNGSSELRLPAWLLNSHEWASVTYASARIQKPILVQSLRFLRAEGGADLNSTTNLGGLVAAHIAMFRTYRADPTSYVGFPGNKNVGTHLETLRESLEPYASGPSSTTSLVNVRAQLGELITTRCPGGYWQAFSETDIDVVIEGLEAILVDYPVGAGLPSGNEDLPIDFDPTKLPDQLDAVTSLTDFVDSARYVGGLKLRTRSLMNDHRIQPILNPDQQPSLDEWLEDYLGNGDGGSIAVIDLSLVPSDVIEIVVAVAARLTFEALQRHRRRFGRSLPTTLVLEEAHTFVRQRPFGDEHTTPAELCTRAFERIAREGRKFGLGLVISSQRPSELSATVLAQCNSFLLHRIVNDADQQLVGRLVPDSLAGLLDELPSLPSRHGLLVGWAAPFPTLVEMRHLAKEHRPHSDDPDFWATWTGEREAAVDWKAVAHDWVKGPPAQSSGSG